MMIVEPCSNQPIPDPCTRRSRDFVRPRVADVQQYIQPEQADAGDKNGRHRHQRDGGATVGEAGADYCPFILQ